MIIKNRFFTLMAYPKYEPAHFVIAALKTGVFEDFFFSGSIATDIETLKRYSKMNKKRMKKVWIGLTIFNYDIQLEIPYKKVGEFYFGRKIDILEKKGS